MDGPDDQYDDDTRKHMVSVELPHQGTVDDAWQTAREIQQLAGPAMEATVPPTSDPQGTGYQELRFFEDSPEEAEEVAEIIREVCEAHGAQQIDPDITTLD